MIIRKITKAGRKRENGTSGKDRVRYVLDYFDANGKRHQPVFATEKLAKAHQARVIVEMAGGVHVADSDSITVDEAWDNFKGALERGGYSRSSIENHRIYYEGHVQPFLGAVKLTTISPAVVKRWTVQLEASGRSDDTIRRTKMTLGAIFDDAIGDGNAASNPAKAYRKRRARRTAMKEKRSRVTIPSKEIVREILALAGDRSRWAMVRHRENGIWKTLELVDIPAPAEGEADATKSTVIALKRKYGVPLGAEIPDWKIESWQTAAWVRPFLALLSFGALRIGEARGMRWPSLAWRLSTMRVENAVDRFDEEGELKTEAATRTVKMGPLLRNTLRAWFEACGEPESGYLFPSAAGTPIGYPNIVNRQLVPLWLRLAHAKPELGILKPDGTPRISPHHLRHFAVSLWAEQGKKVEEISKLVGHADVTVTLRIYWHLFEKQISEAEDEQLAAAELSVMGVGL